MFFVLSSCVHTTLLDGRSRAVVSEIDSSQRCDNIKSTAGAAASRFRASERGRSDERGKKRAGENIISCSPCSQLVELSAL